MTKRELINALAAQIIEEANALREEYDDELGQEELIEQLRSDVCEELTATLEALA
jgi:hypothetical protein